MNQSSLLKIVVIAGFAPSIINFRKELIMALQEYAEVVVLAPWHSLDTRESIVGLGVRYKSIFLNIHGINPWHDLKSKGLLVKFFKEYSPDIVFSYTIKPVIWGSLAAKKAGIKKIYAMITGLGYAFTNTQGLKPKLVQMIATWLYKKALQHNDTIFFQNPDDRQLFQRLNITSKNKKIITLNGSGVDLMHYEHSQPELNPIRFLLIARLLKDKGIFEYVHAAQIIKKKFPRVEFHLVGYIDDNPAAISLHLLDQWITQGAIIFHGKLDDVRPAIRSCSVYVLPSYREGTPRSTLEAMSMGRAIITTDTPGCRETVIDGYNGFLVPVQDVDALVVSMIKLIQNPALIKAMGLNSRQLAEKKYDVHAVNKVILKAMELVS